MSNILMELFSYLLISVCFNLVLFIPAFIFKTDKLTDISYAVSFIFLSVLAFLNREFVNLYDLLILGMVLIWSIRLGGYLFIRINKTGKDKRFDKIRGNFFKFMGFWLIQGVTVWIVLIPTLLFLNSNNVESGLWFVVLGALIWLDGFILETVSDYQKYKYIKDREESNKDRHWVDVGFWKHSRHPNYLGEISLWFGIFIFSISRLDFWLIILSAVSPIFIFVIIRYFSGVPILERKDQERWGTDPDYLTYKEKTGLLFPKF